MPIIQELSTSNSELGHVAMLWVLAELSRRLSVLLYIWDHQPTHSHGS